MVSRHGREDPGTVLLLARAWTGTPPSPQPPTVPSTIPCDLTFGLTHSIFRNLALRLYKCIEKLAEGFFFVFTICQSSKDLQDPPTGRWENVLWHIHTRKLQPLRTRKEPEALTWKNTYHEVWAGGEQAAAHVQRNPVLFIYP